MPLVTIEQELGQAPCLCLVELQGKLEVEGEEQANLDIGTLRMVKVHYRAIWRHIPQPA